MTVASQLAEFLACMDLEMAQLTLLEGEALSEVRNLYYWKPAGPLYYNRFNLVLTHPDDRKFVFTELSRLKFEEVIYCRSELFGIYLSILKYTSVRDLKALLCPATEPEILS